MIIGASNLFGQLEGWGIKICKNSFNKLTIRIGQFKNGNYCGKGCSLLKDAVIIGNIGESNFLNHGINLSNTRFTFGGHDGNSANLSGKNRIHDLAQDQITFGNFEQGLVHDPDAERIVLGQYTLVGNYVFGNPDGDILMYTDSGDMIVKKYKDGDFVEGSEQMIEGFEMIRK